VFQLRRALEVHLQRELDDAGIRVRTDCGTGGAKSIGEGQGECYASYIDLFRTQIKSSETTI
jgi:hypothetical protein